MATSAVDLIVPVGLLIWVLLNPLTIFFIFLWKGGSFHGLSFASILGFVLAALSFVIGVTPQPILWIFDNQTTTFTTVYMVPQAQSVDLYYGITIYQIFLIIVSSLRLMFESGLLGKEKGDTD